MPKQLTFDLPAKPALGRDDFFISPANALAVATVSNSENWPGGKLVLVGPKGSGKTHLVHVWANDTNAAVINADTLGNADIPQIVRNNRHVAVEDADAIAGDQPCENALFHLHNLCLAEGGRLLLTATQAPNLWNLTLPDLASRVQGTNIAILTAPDDALLAAVLVKLFSDRQLVVSPETIAYLVTRIERSFDNAQTVVAKLDDAALTERRAITQRFAARVLDKSA